MESLRAFSNSVYWNKPSCGRAARGKLACMDHLPNPLHADAEAVCSFMHAEHLDLCHGYPSLCPASLDGRQDLCDLHRFRTLALRKYFLDADWLVGFAPSVRWQHNQVAVNSRLPCDGLPG